MIKVRLLNKAQGIGKTSGRPWCRLTLAADHNDGSRVVNDFFVNPEVATKVSSIPLDSLVYISAELDSNLHFNVADIRVAETTKS